MDIMEILKPLMAIGGMGALFGIGLGFAAKKFAVPVDERVEQIKEHLPGANCGGCGFAGCDAFAKAVVAGEAPVGGCPVSNDTQRQGIAQVMGQEVGESEAIVAIVRCKGTKEAAREKYQYEGVRSCQDAHLVHGGPKGCQYGCLGMGSCVEACSFDALTIEDGIAKVDKAKCKACGACIKACPRHLIYIGKASDTYQVQCMSRDKGKDVKAWCSVGCIGCGICLKQCEVGAITVTNQYATIDPAKCIACGKCEVKCPTKAIHMI
ncbi:MAG: RnfABCDGE type electron transport complex subunit B [Cellulosilyticaceae bacterium]